MPRGKNYVNQGKGMALQASTKRGGQKMIVCQYGTGCNRPDCIYEHPYGKDDGKGRSSANSSQSREPHAWPISRACARSPLRDVGSVIPLPLNVSGSLQNMPRSSVASEIRARPRDVSTCIRETKDTTMLDTRRTRASQRTWCRRTWPPSLRSVHLGLGLGLGLELRRRRRRRGTGNHLL